MSTYPSPPPSGGWQPPVKHPQSTTALVLGILGLVVCGILGPFAWYIGGKAVREIDAEPGRYDGRGEANAGQILGIIATVFLIIGLLTVLAIIVLTVIAASTAPR